MTHYEAIKNLTEEQLEKFLDQVFLTGLNTGYQSVADSDVEDDNPFNAGWLNADIEEHPALVEDETGALLIIEPFLKILQRITEFDMDSIPGDISWQRQVVLPKGAEDE